MVSHYDLKENAQYHADEQVGLATMLEFMATDRLDEMIADFDDLKRGLITERRLCAGGDESIGDKTRVPAGAGMFHGITFAPYKVTDKRWSDQHWDEFKEEIGDLSLAHYRKFVKNLTSDNIIARSIVSPVDLERSSPNSMMRGDLHGVAPYFHQSAGARPTSDLGQYTVPGVERLFLAGPRSTRAAVSTGPGVPPRSRSSRRWAWTSAAWPPVRARTAPTPTSWRRRGRRAWCCAARPTRS
jgi:hypothetical protein